MKYPKEYSKKALDVLEREYFKEDKGASNTALLTLAAHCINLVAKSSPKNILSFYMVREAVVEPEESQKKNKAIGV